MTHPTWALICVLVAGGGAGCKSSTPRSATATEPATDDHAGPGPKAANDHKAAAPEAAPAADWCGGHGLPESKCTKCNPELIPRFKEAGDWCEAHGYPESACPTCNPQARPTAQAPPTATATSASDWCGGHALPESKCTKCNPELIPRFKEAGDWCEAHGYPESACPTCNPQAPPAGQDATADWCREHGLPESQCTKCNPELIAGFKGAGDWCEAHGYPESVCPTCSPQAPPAAEQLYTGLQVRIRSPDLERAAGIATVPARVADVAAVLTVPARLAWDEGRVHEVSAPSPGMVREALAETGARVEAGAPLFVLESAALGDLQARQRAAKDRVATARAELTRQKALRADQIASARDVDVARQSLAEAQADQRANEASLSMTGDRGDKAGRYTVSAPAAGLVVTRAVRPGQWAEAGASLATIADPTVLWALLDVPQSDAAALRPGLPVTLDAGGVAIAATIDTVAPDVDPRTRAVRARVTVPNADGRLRVRQLLHARIQIDPPERAVAVPRMALQRVDGATLVFVRTAEQVFEPRVVRPGRRSGDHVQVSGRLVVGDQVVTTGAWLLRTEVVPGTIGAGCCGD